MHIIEIPSRGETHYMPSVISELNRSQFLVFCQVLKLIETEKITEEQGLLKLAISLADIDMGWKNWRYAVMSKRKKMYVHENLNQLVTLSKTIFDFRQVDDKEIILVPSISFIDNKIRNYKGFEGPDDALQNCTFFEYKELYSQWYQYQKTEDEKHLDEMIAIMYRPRKSFLWIKRLLKNYNGDPRQPYSVITNPIKLEKRIRKVAKWPDHVKYGIWLWITGCMEFLRTGKPMVDGNEIDLGILYKGEEGGAAGIGLTGVLYSLAETGVFGTIRQTGDTNLYDVLARLYQVKLQLDEIKAKSKER